MKIKQALKWVGVVWAGFTAISIATPFVLIWTSGFTGIYTSGFRVPVFPLGVLNVVDACEGQGLVNFHTLLGTYTLYDNNIYLEDGSLKPCFKPTSFYLGEDT